jgi:hypothetical protein
MNTTKFFFPTSTVKTIENYPYGFKLRTTKKDSVEFKPGSGFRYVEQTINPKTGRENKPKKSTYNTIGLLFEDATNGHISFYAINPNSAESVTTACLFLSDHYNLFTPDQIKDISKSLYNIVLADFQACVIYCGCDPEKLKPFYVDPLSVLKSIFSSGENDFHKFSIDLEGIESLKIKDFNPFKVTQYTTI